MERTGLGNGEERERDGRMKKGRQEKRKEGKKEKKAERWE